MDCTPKYDYYTVTLDTVGQDHANVFTCFLAQPIHNIVQAKLMAAHIRSTGATEHYYVSIEELDSNFSEHTSNVYEGQSSMTNIRNSFASLVTDRLTFEALGNDSILSFKDEYDVETNYIYPIRSIDRFRVKILDHLGKPVTPPSVSGDNFLIIRFKCMR